MARDSKVKIWQVKDDNFVTDNDGGAVLTYTYVDAESDNVFKASSVKRRDGKKATLEELVNLCDKDAEDINAHDYVGAHRLLGAVLYRQLGRKGATKIMLDIAERRGLHGMGGISGTADAYEELGVGECGHDWDGTYGE